MEKKWKEKNDNEKTMDETFFFAQAHKHLRLNQLTASTPN